jgi:hypothetical protein
VFVTWGVVKVATVQWFAIYAAEAWVMIDPLWVRALIRIARCSPSRDVVAVPSSARTSSS